MLLVVDKFLPLLKLFTAGDIAARGGNFGGSTLAADAPTAFFGIKFWVVLFIIAAFAPAATVAPVRLFAELDALRLLPKLVAVFAMFADYC